MDQRQTVASLIAKAHRYRDLARWIGDPETMQRISAFAEEHRRSNPNSRTGNLKGAGIWAGSYIDIGIAFDPVGARLPAAMVTNFRGRGR